MVLRAAGDIAVDMPVLLQSSGHAGRHQRLERTEYGGAPDPWLTKSKVVVQVTGGHLPTDGAEGIGHHEPLVGDALASVTQAIRRRACRQCPPTAPTKAEKA